MSDDSTATGGLHRSAPAVVGATGATSQIPGVNRA